MDNHDYNSLYATSKHYVLLMHHGWLPMTTPSPCVAYQAMVIPAPGRRLARGGLRCPLRRAAVAAAGSLRGAHGRRALRAAPAAGDGAEVSAAGFAGRGPP